MRLIIASQVKPANTTILFFQWNQHQIVKLNSRNIMIIINNNSKNIRDERKAMNVEVWTLISVRKIMRENKKEGVWNGKEKRGTDIAGSEDETRVLRWGNATVSAILVTFKASRFKLNLIRMEIKLTLTVVLRHRCRFLLCET